MPPSLGPRRGRPAASARQARTPLAARLSGLLLGLLAFALPAPAHAATDWASSALFARPGPALAMTGLVLVVAALVNRFARQKRGDVGRTVILLLCFLACYGLGAGLGALGQAEWANMAFATAELLGIITAINIAALSVLDLALPAIGIELASILSDLTVGVAYVVAILAFMRRAGVELSGIVATSAVVTGILALSFQATLGNVVGGIALQADKSVRVGDWVQLENGKEGRVREIRWRHAVLETREWDTLIVPNAVLLGATITVLGKRAGEPLQRRMWVHFNVDFHHPPADVIHAVEDALRAAAIEGATANPPPDCVLLDVANKGQGSYAHYAARFFVTDFLRDVVVASAVRVRVFSALRRAGIPLALPSATLFVEQEDAAREAHKRAQEIDRRMRALAEVELLRALREDELRKVAEDLEYAPFAAGETVTKQGELAHWLYIIASGIAEVRVGVGGEDRKVAEIRAPGFFGEMGLMTGEPRSATVVAATDLECYRLDKPHFQAIVRDRPELAHEISTRLAARKVALQAAREGLDVASKQTRLDAEKRRLLSSIQIFFGMHDERKPPSSGRPG